MIASACQRRSDEPPRVRSVEKPAASVPAVAVAPVAEPLELLSAPGSAYQAALAADGEAFYVATSSAAYRLKPGEPARRFELDLGYGSALTRTSFLFWSGGAIVEAGKRGGQLQRIAALPERPQAFVSSGDDFAWLERGADGRGTLRSIVGAKLRTSYASPAAIDALTMLNDWIFFAERVDNDSFRIGGVRAAGATPTFTPARRGRSPAMLVAQRDLYYYDGNSFEVRRLSPDLQNETTLIKDFVCSPIAVASEHVYCGSVEGIFELVAGATPRRLVPGLRQRPVADLAANDEYVAWLGEAGADSLVVSALSVRRNRAQP